MKEILYIGGYGRSGSTILALLLSCSESACSVGEVGAMHRAFRENRPCTCGVELACCPFWGKVVRRTPRITNQDLRRRGVDVRVAIDHAFRQSGANFLIDSTKTSYRNAFRPWRLHRAGYRVFMVRLVRGVSSVIESSRKGRNSELETGQASSGYFIRSRVLLSWGIANLAAMAYGLVPSIKYITIKYEDLISNPIATIDKIERLTGHDFSAAREAAVSQVTLTPGHEINGNRILRDGPVRLHIKGNL